MTDEPADSGLEAADLPKFDRPLTELTAAELMSLKAAYAARGIRIVNSVPWEIIAPLLAGAAVYSKAFIETLAKHNADSLASLVHDRFRRNGKTTEVIVGTGDSSAATLVITADLPDEARLALLDLDVTAPELRGKELRWDSAAGEWRP